MCRKLAMVPCNRNFKLKQFKRGIDKAENQFSCSLITPETYKIHGFIYYDCARASSAQGNLCDLMSADD